MLNSTNIDACKIIAKNLLDIEVTIVNQDVFPIISHPIIKDAFIPDSNKGIINILEEPDALNEVVTNYTEFINDAKDYSDLMMLITNPYKLFFLKLTKDYLDIKNFSTHLISSWIADENANDNVNVSKDELVEYFKEASIDYLMDEEDKKVYYNLEEVIIIYRGLNNMEKYTEALSWTLSIEKANWFAHRFSQDGDVYSAKIKKEDVLAYCDQRNEQEVIVDYTKLFDIELIS